MIIIDTDNLVTVCKAFAAEALGKGYVKEVNAPCPNRM
jgi:hypothetical protein